MENFGDTASEQYKSQFYKTIGNNIRIARKTSGIQQEELANRLKISRVSLSNIESGKQRLPVHLLHQIATIFNITISTILSKKPEPQIESPEEVAKKIRERINKNRDEINHFLNQDLPLDIIYFNVRRLSTHNEKLILRLKELES